ncbi:hypothetical protein BN000_00624 [Mycobacterium europaeum]|uniref:Uncharacterized protein n=1 Tax=Mycobacterium europaeum TaxID=761804 RepID=A0A0U1CX60_9MYCO|nr:hypothetical protein [Mycobacterium europaeum]CQD03696.1 hypothetical protein BN000_00624 [Mycobacterium europaeum]
MSADVVEPVELFTDEYIWESHRGQHPGSRVVLNFHRPSDHDGCLEESAMCYWGSLLWMGDVVYRIGEYVRDVHSWWGRWPD